jgi:alkanesulfonate monooxygenase SsuD/methylene tetrahydromethanopterin reductase-like flavin-dependent oxidoreductase (luciferase family)
VPLLARPLQVSIDDDAPRARSSAEQFFGGTYRSDFCEFWEWVACVGTPDEVTERLAAFVAAGVDHLVLVPVSQAQSSARRLLADVVPRLEREYR